MGKTSRRLVTQAELAQLHGVSHVTVRAWERAGMPVAQKGRSGVAGKYDVAETIEWRLREATAKVAARAGGQKGKTLSIEDERARLVKEQADGQALKNGILRGDLLHVDVVVATWSHQIATARTRLRAIKSKLRSRMPKLTLKQLDAIDELISQACNELAVMDAPDVSESLAAIGEDVGSPTAADA